MPASVTSICNEALALVGAERINAIGDSNDRARACADHYEAARDEVLESYDWNCAGALASLAADPDAPDWGFDYRYQQPAGCLKVREINGERDFGDTYKVLGRYIHTDAGEPLEIRYTAVVSDVTQMPPSLRSVIAARLAAKIAYAVTGKANLGEGLERLYRVRRREATRADAREGSADPVDASDWAEARL